MADSTSGVSSELFKTIFMNTSIGIVWMDSESFKIKTINPAFLDVFDLDENCIGKSGLDVFPNLIVKDNLDIISDIINNGGKHKHVIQLLKNDAEKSDDVQFFVLEISRVNFENEFGLMITLRQIGERLFFEKRMAESKEKFDYQVAGSLFSKAILIGEDAQIEIANERMILTLGKGYNILGSSIFDLFPELKSQKIAELYKLCLEEETKIFEKCIPIEININGVLKHLFLKFALKPITNKRGDQKAVLLSVLNITDLVLAKQKLYDREALLKHFIENLPVAINVLEGKDFVYRVSNKISESVWGYKIDIGTRVIDTVPGIEERPIFKNLQKVFNEGIQYEKKEHEYVDAKGNTQYINYIFQPIRDVDGNVKYVMTLGYDVSEELKYKKQLRENEKKFKTLAESMPQLVWTADNEGSADYFNSNWYTVTDIQYGENPWGNLEKLLGVSPSEAKVLTAEWYNCIANKKVYEKEMLFNNYKKTGKKHWFLVRAIPIYNDEKMVDSWIGTCTDIDDFKQLQQQKDDFLGIASHELKTPLTSLKLYSQYIGRNLQNIGDTANASVARKMDEQINKLTELIAELLDVTKIQNGRIELKSSKFDFNDLVNEVVEEQQMASRHQILVNAKPVGMIEADRHRLSQVMSNLIGNAIKYSPDADKVVVTAEHLGDKIRFCVQDYGIGIPEEKIEHVFKQYYRVSGEKEHTIPGLGLGLYISAEIIKRSNGNIYVNSERGKGSNFCFELPVKN
ncbi:PAS domain S-box-containing protein [Soonwooa buanensis]|uniref:histidine kinase n=1 Tax=Soonwooa buanensis TaxID=619805 RepID=A0A1T5DV14_9FLAO|nr:PAS domain-containing sensor histidine kinase [Soonwooa buanensis]SKB75380.1 PAS domain S-box-containing protein [Soonwooa buanensis]